MTEDKIIDLSQPGVIHIIYPSGLKVNPNMMDPNIGDWHKGAGESK